MLGRELESFWWEEVAGPHAMVAGIVTSLLECKSVVLSVPADLPWRHQMRRSVQSIMELTPGLDSLYIEPIDIGDEDQTATPGNLVLERFALYDDRIRYRASAETVQHYAERKRLLANKIVWVKGASSDQSGAWIDFCRHWHPSNPAQGLFVIEDHGASGDPSGALKTIDYSKCADENSVRLFMWSMLSGAEYASLSPQWRTYMVSALTNLCREDVEVASLLSEELDILNESPIDGIIALSQSPSLSRRGEQGSDHVLALARDGRSHDLHHRLWAAQIEVLFPIIESARIALIDRLSDNLSALIDDGKIVQFGETITNVDDVELGTLVHLMSRDSDGNRPLYVSDQDVRDRIHLLWRCRNLLAHRKICAPEQVGELFEIVHS